MPALCTRIHTPVTQHHNHHQLSRYTTARYCSRRPPLPLLVGRSQHQLIAHRLPCTPVREHLDILETVSGHTARTHPHRRRVGLRCNIFALTFFLHVSIARTAYLDLFSLPPTTNPCMSFVYNPARSVVSRVPCDGPFCLPDGHLACRPSPMAAATMTRRQRMPPICVCASRLFSCDARHHVKRTTHVHLLLIAACNVMCAGFTAAQLKTRSRRNRRR